jgi:hypothetical protein
MRALRARRQLRATGLKALGILAGVGLLWGLFALSTADGGDRMSPFGEAPSSVHDDLLYLTYIDSLARDDRAVPTGVVEEELLAQQLVLLSGTPRRTAEAWGLFPRSEEGQGPLNELFRELNRGGRIILPLYGAALGTHLKERRLHPGYLVFGQTSRAGPNEADFCGVLTAVNSIQPEFSALIYRDPDTGRLVHGSYEDMPDFGYLGGGRLGDDIPAVYREYFQYRAARGRKALYK